MLTRARLSELLTYDPQTGLFRWREGRRGRCSAGSVAGTITKKGYVKICVDGKIYRAHRLAWLWMTGRWPAHDVDHEDLNKANNIFSNLREATKPQNSANRGPQRNNKSGFKGVHYNAQYNRYYAQIMAGGRKIFLGSHASAEDASAAYAKAAEIHFGEFARAA